MAAVFLCHGRSGLVVGGGEQHLAPLGPRYQKIICSQAPAGKRAAPRKIHTGRIRAVGHQQMVFGQPCGSSKCRFSLNLSAQGCMWQSMPCLLWAKRPPGVPCPGPADWVEPCVRAYTAVRGVNGGQPSLPKECVGPGCCGVRSTRDRSLFHHRWGAGRLCNRPGADDDNIRQQAEGASTWLKSACPN